MKTNIKKFDFIDLFAGIGGFHIALHNKGGKCVFASEWDDHARKTYEFNFKKISPDIFKSDKKYFAGDITKYNVDEIPDHDILSAGFPCQPFSQAGYKKGFEDTRGTLFFNIAEITKVKRPKVLLLENVRGLLNHDGGNTLKTIIRVLNEMDYSFHYKVLKASDFNLPQHRPRLFMVAFRGDIDDSNFTFPEPISLKLTMSDIFDGAEVDREIGFTLRVGGKSSPINDRRNWDGYIVNGDVKRLTPKEGKKLQGFPDNYQFPVSDSQAMKQLGNSVAIPVVEKLLESILKTLYSEVNVDV